ncbi:ankyrin repeat domain-containing protein [Wolbachia endosymbiont (group B) of Chorthippus parallelus]|uniref:ankyrin repeat domain-containing protein n=1 Tax=Wolbachia endosymbiont (group B) of Chorthippus parallelus TaxID=2953997 RepID=UPI002231CCBB|nr:ankyrin repeat domain-containing protein [Wolbachia endosymbiont (group B) of Chorthippus parallelus]
MHSVAKQGFFPHFFLGSFSTFIDTEIAVKLDIEKICFCFDGPQTLKVAIIRKGDIKGKKDVIDKIRLFVISEKGAPSATQKFSYGELRDALGRSQPARFQPVFDNQGELRVKLVTIDKGNVNQQGVLVVVEDKKLHEDDASKDKFKEIKKGVWNNPESDIAKLTNSDAEEVSKPLEKILKKVSGIHSEYENSIVYADQAREAAHHGFIAGALVNFRYRYNLRVYLEQFAGRGYADIVLVPRGKDRSLNAVPIIIELKAGTGRGTTPENALEQAKDYAKGFQPNTMRVLTISDNVLCVGLNLDSTEKFSMYISPPADRKPARPTIQKLLEVTSSWSGEESAIADLKKEIKQPLERIYHTFPGTPEKGGNYFSRFLLGQLLLANEFKRVDLKRFIFLYDEYPLDSTTKSGKPVTTFTLIRGGRNEEVFIFHVREGGRGDRSSKKILMPDSLTEQSKITEVYISLSEQKKSDFFNIEEVNRYDSLSEYKKGKDFFKGKLKEVPYLNGLREAFDEAFKSQITPAAGKVLSVDKYDSLTKKVGEGMFSFKDFIGEEAHFQGVLHGAFSYYSDLKLKESPRALILTEFQTGRGKRIDMVVHGISTDKDGNAKEYDPVGLELKGPREGKTADALVKEANDQINTEYVKGVTYKTLTDGKEVAFMGVVFDKGANNADSLILMSKDEFDSVKVVHSSIFSFSQQQCSKGRKQRSTGMACIDSRDEEEITKEEKERFIKELFGIEAYDTKIITIDSPQVRIDGGKMSVKFKDNDGNDKELIIDNATNIKSIENYILDKENLEIKLKVSSDKEYAIIEEIKDQSSEYYLKIDDYRIELDSIFQDGKEVIFDKLHQLSNDKQLLENKKYIEDIGDVQTNQDYNNIVEEIKQNLLAKGVREDTFDRFKSHFDDLGEKVFAGYISNVESSLQEKGIAFDHDKFDSAKIKGAKGGKFFSMMAIYDLLDSISDTATLGRHDNNALKQVFGINGILDAMDDVRTSVSISPSSKVGKLIGKIPGPARQAFVKVISNPVVQSITFATIAYQFGYSINEIAQGNHHPLNYYWTTSSGVKLASMSIRPISAGVSFTIKSVSATTKILRGLSAAGKVLGRAAVVTMVADVLITMGVKIHERMEYTKAIAEQVPLLPGGEQAEVFFAGVIKFFTGRDVEKEYEDTIRIKGYLTYVKEAAIKLLNDNYDIAAVVQYVISIEEKYSEVIKNMGAQPICIMPSPYGPGCATQMKWTCDLEKKYDNISSDKINTASNVKNDLSSLDISKALPMIPYTLNMRGFECTLPVLGTIAFPAGSFIANKCLQESYEKEKVYIVNTEAKHIPHLTKYEYKDLGLRIVDAPLTNPIQKSQCSKTINTKHKGDDAFAPCNSGKIYRNCQESFTLSGEPFIFTNPTRKEHSNTKKQTFPRGSVLYISGPKTLTAAANYPAVMHISEGSNIRYVGSKNNETIFIINDYMSGTLEGGPGKENTLVMNVKANNIAANLHSGTIRYGNSNNIRLVNTYNYVSNSDSKQNITTHCKTRLINVKNAEVWQNSFNCTDKDYEVRVVNKENVHNRGLKQTIFVVNEDSDNAKIVSDLGSTGKIKGNIDIIKVQVANITQWRISEDIEKVGYSLDLLANNTQSIVSSTKINDFKNLVIQVDSNGITESVAIQDKSLSDTIEDIRYQELKSSGGDISREVVQNSAKKLKAFIQASILDQGLLDTYQIAKDIVNNNNFDIPVSQVEVIKNHMGVPSEKVIISGMYSGQVIVDFSYSSSDVTSSYQKYLNNGRNYGYDDYVMLCNYYQDITIEGEKGQNQYIIKLPDTLNSKISSSPIRLNLKIKNKAVPIPYSIIDFAELSVTGVDSISIEQGKRDYINECYGKSISDLTEDSLEIQDITILDSKGTKWSLSIGLVDYFKNLENQQIVLRINNELYKIDSTNLRLEHLEINPSFFRYYQPEEQGLQIYHNQPIDKNDIGLVDFRDKSILDFDTEITDDSLVLSHKNNTLAKVENWNTYQPAREMVFAFNDTMVSNLKCIVSACNSKDVIEDFNKEKVTLLKEHMFDAIVQNNINEAKGLIRKIESINTESKHELTPLYVAIQEGRLDIVEILFERKHFSVKDKDIYGCNPLHWAAQQGNLNIAKFLVERGADIGAKDKNGRTSLRIAACNGSLDIVKFFLDKNASIEAKSNDPYKMMGIVKSAKKEIINQADTSSNVRRWAEFFVEELRYSIRSVTKEKLKDGMLRNRYSSVNELANEIYKSDGKLFDDIIKGVINEVYGRVDTKEILSYVRSHNNVDQRISGYVAVFDAMQRNGDLNNSAIFKLAYSIKEATSFDKYSSLDSEKRSDLKRLKSKLPESVKNIVFASKVCIKNIDHNEYLYAASNYLSYDDDRRRVFTWIPKDEKNDKFRWEIKLDGDDYSIMNVEFNEYLYGAVDYFNYDNERRKVFTWIPGGRVGRDTWKIEPIGSSCYIMNVELNEYLYAAVDHFNYDDERRRVFTWIPKNSKSDQFKWNIEDCGHAVKRRDISSSHTDLNSDTTRSSRKAELDKELLSATKIGNLSEVKNLVNQGASVDAEDKDGNTPFHNAALKGYLTIAQYLVEKGVDVNASNEDGWTPMHGSALKGHLEVVRFLIEKGANISAENIFGEKPIHCAAKRNNKDIIEVLLRKGASINDADKNGRTPLYFASWNGYLGLVEYFVRDKKANINIKDKYGKTPLDVAIDRNHISVIGYLSKKQLELCKELLVVVQSGDLSKVQDLVNQGASLDIQSEDGLTLLHFAFIDNRLDIAGYLIKEGVDINVRDNDGATCLHYVSRFGRLNAVKYLISKGADIDAEDSNDRTPLDVADPSIIKILRQAHLDKELLITVQSSDLERIKSLIAQGVSKDEHGAYYFAWIGNLGTVKFIVENEGGVNVTDKYGCTLLHWAARGGHLEIVKFLLEKGANINARSILGRTPIHVAAINNRKNIVEFFISKGADINDADKDGWTPLHWAASRGNLEVTKFLVEKGANINAENVFGRKPIHRAAEDNHKNIIDFLLSKGVSVDDADKQGHTPLYWASWGGHLDMVKYLIGKGADINAKDKGGKTPLDIAKDKGHNNIVEYLEKRLREERGEPLQRKRRHHHGDHNHHHMSRKPLAIDSSNQPEIATSSAIKPSSWINDLFNWVKGSVGGLLNSKPTLSKETSNTSSPISQVDAKMDVNGTIMLLDVLVRKVTGQKYVSTVDQPISSLKAQGYALNITNRFEKVVEQAALKSGISMHRLNIDYMGMQKEITRKVMRGKFNEISGILKSYVEKACPGEEAGKLSPKKFEKFIAQFNKGLLNQSIEQILHNKDGTLEVGGAKQMSLEPQSYLSNACVQSHSKVSTCLSEIGVTKLGGNLNR